MPELPEVETTRLGIQPHVQGKKIEQVVIRQSQLRWSVPQNLNQELAQQKFNDIQRRAKYLLFEANTGCMIIHLGMSGSLRVVDKKLVPKKHDHIDFIFNTGKVLRFHDPRRFGCVLWTQKHPRQHKLLAELGPEPLGNSFTGDYLYDLSRTRKVCVKNFIMNSHVVVGIGNIYASEALFLSGIHPQRAANRVSLQRYEKLVNNIKKVLQQAIKAGGTTLRDFVREDGNPGYFANKLLIYNKHKQPCPQCSAPIQLKVLGQRSSYYCKQCQT